jgi:hypothetical protein
MVSCRLLLGVEVSVSEGESGGIFVSYRRQVSSGTTGRLTDSLVEHFGAGRVFIDVDTIEPGVDFTEVIARAVETCGVLLAIISPGWLTVSDEVGHRRLDDPEDFVRREIETALGRDVRVIPILVDNAIMPRWQDLPESLVELARRNAFIIRYESFRYDVERLVASLDGVINSHGQEKAKNVRSPEEFHRVEETAQTGNAISPEQHSMRSVAPGSRIWELERASRKGNRARFLLSSSQEVHEIIVVLSFRSDDIIEVDGERINRDRAINGGEYAANTLSSKLGSNVTITVVGVPLMTRIWSVTVKVGPQVLACFLM